ncbi:MAG: hypothetical protein DLM58_15305 [Pseudonocardiales bacterium]|nr:MAG: hypothetical protein DLM58_15305 [Pseudonocardiales bacterium]
MLWGKLTDRAKGVFADLLDNPSGRPNGEDLAKRLGIPNGKYGIAGVLAWPGRHCTAAGRPLPIRNDEGAAGGSTYWIPEIPARLFAQARAASDSRTTED